MDTAKKRRKGPTSCHYLSIGCYLSIFLEVALYPWVNPYGKYKRHNDAHESFITVNFAAKLGTHVLQDRIAWTKEQHSIAIPNAEHPWDSQVVGQIWELHEGNSTAPRWPPRKQHHRPYMKSASLYSGRNNCGWCGIGTSNNSFRRFPFCLASIPLPARLVRGCQRDLLPVLIQSYLLPETTSCGLDSPVGPLTVIFLSPTWFGMCKDCACRRADIANVRNWCGIVWSNAVRPFFATSAFGIRVIPCLPVSSACRSLNV